MVHNKDNLETVRVLNYKPDIPIPLQAYELDPDNPTAGIDDPLTSVEATLTITIRDVNNNGPVFTPNRYTVSLPEDIPNDTPLPDLAIPVADKDQVRLYTTLLSN